MIVNTSLPFGDRLALRLLNLYLGLALCGVSIAMMLSSRLGLDPWDVFHQGLARRTGLPIGWTVNIVGVVVLPAWLPLRQRPGIGTVSNVVVVRLVADATLAVLHPIQAITGRAALLAGGILANAIATGLYVGAGLGAGPRDGLMTGLAARGHSIRTARTTIELSVLALGWTLGGTVGAGTVLYALTIGPLAQFFISTLAVSPAPTAPPSIANDQNKESYSHDHSAVRCEHPCLGHPGSRPRRRSRTGRTARI